MTVPPRVIPLFLHELASVPRAMRLANLATFAENADRVFARAKVEDEDVMDLIATLLSLASTDTAFFENGQDGGGSTTPSESAAQVTLRILTHICDPTWRHCAVTYRALTRIQKRIRAHREEAAPESLLAGDHTTAVNDTLAHLSPVKSNNADTSLVALNSTANEPGNPAHPRLPVIAAAVVHPEQLAAALYMDAWFAHDAVRAGVIELWRTWDSSGIDLSFFARQAETIHLFVPQRLTSRLKVYRDFAMCTQRPKLTKQWGSVSVVHIKTNIRAQSDVMYRFLVEGYNYGVNAAIHSDAVGFTNKRWEDIGNMTKYGWPEGWDAEMTNDYAAGCAISQYYSSDRFLVLRLRAKSFFSVGFSVSAWLVFHGLGEGFPVTVTFHHQDDDL